MSVAQAIALVLERDPDLRFGETSISCLISFSMFYSNLHSFLSEISFFFFRQEGLANNVLQWYLCRMEGWFATDADNISLKNWDQVKKLFCDIAI